jgi:hypothetical protein
MMLDGSFLKIQVYQTYTHMSLRLSTPNTHVWLGMRIQVKAFQIRSKAFRFPVQSDQALKCVRVFQISSGRAYSRRLFLEPSGFSLGFTG